MSRAREEAQASNSQKAGSRSDLDKIKLKDCLAWASLHINANYADCELQPGVCNAMRCCGGMLFPQFSFLQTATKSQLCFGAHGPLHSPSCRPNAILEREYAESNHRTNNQVYVRRSFLQPAVSSDAAVESV